MKRTITILGALALAMCTSCSSTATADIANAVKEPETRIESEAPVTEAPATENLNDADIILKIDTDSRGQTIDGFGAAYCWGLRDFINAKEKDKGEDLLFTEAGMSILRLKNEYDYGSTKDPEVGTTENLKELIDDAGKRIKENYGENIVIMLSSWSPPEYLKSNNSTRGGTLKKNEDGRFCYDEFANWWVESIKYYRENGIPVNYITIQNEPDWSTDLYDTCYFTVKEREDTPSFEYATIKVYEAIKKEFGNKAPKILGYDVMGPGSPYIKVTDLGLITAGTSYHLYQGSRIDRTTNTVQPNGYTTDLMNLSKKAKKSWQTEFSIGKGMETAELINRCLTFGNSNAYLYWIAARENGSGAGLEEHLVELKNGKASPSGNYYAMKHYSKYIRPGYLMVDGEAQGKFSNTLASSFMSPTQDRLVTVVINKDSEDKTVWISSLPLESEPDEVYTTVYNTDTRKVETAWAEQQPSAKINLPANSITTVVSKITGEFKHE